MNPTFPSDYSSILSRIDQIDPLAYGKTRNYLDGAVTYLSPYISRGIISTKQVLEIVLAKGYSIKDIETFVKELCWRDYFQRLGQVSDLNNPKESNHFSTEINFESSANKGMPSAIIKAATGVNAIDQAIEGLYGHGYMHNHCRMYTASIICNAGKYHWQKPAQWMYYHLLDGDWASNACSWQWVAGIRSKKKYFVNQENINKYSNNHQKNTFLDCSYEDVEQMEIPEALLPSETINLTTTLPASASIQINHQVPTFIYNYYNLDPLWHAEKEGNRVLLIEPDFFSAYPVSEKCISFLLELSKNISEIQIYVGSFESLCTAHRINNAIYKEHPLNIGYFGAEEPRDWIVNELTGYYPSFFSYWKKIEKQLRLKYV